MRTALFACLPSVTLTAANAGFADAFVRLTMNPDGAAAYSASPGAAPDTPFAIASVGKTFTAVAILRLVDRGVLSLDDLVADRVPEAIADTLMPLDGLRLRHLLTMTSGLPDYYTDDWLEDALVDPGLVRGVLGALGAIADDRRPFAPGRVFDYSNTNYVLLGAILEHATGKDYAAVLQAEVFEPAGLTDSFVFGSRPLPSTFARGHPDRAAVLRFYSGQGLGDGGVIASARDVARFYRALFVEGRLVSDAMLGTLLEDPVGAEYGMGIEIEQGIAGHSGGDLGYTSDTRIDLRSGTIAVELVADEDADTGWA